MLTCLLQKSDYFDGVLTLNELWNVFDLDDQWRTIVQRKSKVQLEYKEQFKTDAVMNGRISIF